MAMVLSPVLGTSWGEVPGKTIITIWLQVTSAGLPGHVRCLRRERSIGLSTCHDSPKVCVFFQSTAAKWLIFPTPFIQHFEEEISLQQPTNKIFCRHGPDQSA
jgi:hypothetical protein